MTSNTSKPSLEIEDHSAFQFVFWRAQRIAWIIFLLILLAGVTGAGGPLSRASAEMAGGAVDHPRVSRWNAADEFHIRLAPGGKEREVRLSTAFAEHFQLEDIQPAPVRSIAAPEGDRLFFQAEPGGEASVVLHVRAQKPGVADYAVGLNGEAQRVLRSIVLP